MKQNSALCGRHGRRAVREGQGENYASFFNDVSSIKTTHAVYGQQNCMRCNIPPPAWVQNRL